MHGRAAARELASFAIKHAVPEDESAHRPSPRSNYAGARVPTRLFGRIGPLEPMTPERTRDVELICQAALALEPGARAAFLVKACAGDDALRHEVESRAGIRSRRFLEHSCRCAGGGRERRANVARECAIGATRGSREDR